MKQRLIDANKIRYSDMSDGQVPGGLWYTFKDNVDEMPTVEAIPVEWLINYFNKKCMRVDDMVFIDNHDSHFDIMVDRWELIEDWKNEKVAK